MKNIRVLFLLFSCYLLTITVEAQAVITFVPADGSLDRPAEMAFDHSGNLYVINNYLNGTSSVSKVIPDATVSTFVPTDAGLNLPRGIICDASDNVYVSVIGGTIYKVTPAGVMTVFVNSGLDYPTDITFDAMGNLFVSNSRPPFYINKVTPDGTVSTFVQNGMNYPEGLEFDNIGNLFVANVGNFHNGYISKITPDGTVSTFAQSGLYGPAKLAFDAKGNVFATDIQNQGILFKITPDGTVNVFLSSGLGTPYALAIDAIGNLYIGDNAGNRIFEVLQSELPLTLTDFYCMLKSSAVQLNWHTKAEYNTSQFIVQRSPNGNSFSDIGTVTAVSNGANNYNFNDNHYLNGTNYYRLKLADIDGKFTYSKVIAVKLKPRLFTLSPNPATSFALLGFKDLPAQVQVLIYNDLGKKLIDKEVKSPGIAYQLDLRSLLPGIYIIAIRAGDTTYAEKLVIK